MKQRERVMVIGCVVVVAASLWFALSGNGAPRKTNLVPYDKALQQTAASKLNVRRLEQDEAVLKPRVASRSYNQPAEALVPIVVANLQTAADRAGIHLREVRPLRPKTVTDEQDPAAAPKSATARVSRNTTHDVLGARVPVEVRFKAPFQPNVVKFLYELEDPAGRLVIDKISITSADARFKTVEVSAQITVFTQSAAGSSGTDTGDITDDRSAKG